MVRWAGFALGWGWIGCISAALFMPGAPARAATESVLYSFQGGADGAFPLAPLVAVGGTFYGTTAGGGVVRPGICASGCGTVFSLTPGGTESVLYRFQGGPDGAYPEFGLLDHGGSLFGTTAFGGVGRSSGQGTVFSITSAGHESLVAKFTKAVGIRPNGPLTRVGARLFGIATTDIPGAHLRRRRQ